MAVNISLDCHICGHAKHVSKASIHITAIGIGRYMCLILIPDTTAQTGIYSLHANITSKLTKTPTDKCTCCKIFFYKINRQQSCQNPSALKYTLKMNNELSLALLVPCLFNNLISEKIHG